MNELPIRRPQKAVLIGPIQQENLALQYLAASARRAGHLVEVVSYNDRAELDQAVEQAPETVAWVDTNCRSAGIGCVDCKKKRLERLLPEQEKMRERREKLLARPGEVEELVQLGNSKARAVAQRTMEQVRAAMKL